MVLVVHDDPVLRARIATILRGRGHFVGTAPRADAQLGRATVVVIAAGMLPCDAPGPILALVAVADEAAVVAAFAAGADAVLAGPLRECELASRVAGLGRQTGPAPIRVGPLTIAAASRRVLLDGRPLDLTRREYELICLLAGQPGRVFTKREILRELWDEPAGSPTRRLDTQVARLRRRLGHHRALVVTVWGVGYRLGG